MRFAGLIVGVALTCAARGDYRFEDPRNFLGVWSGPVHERVAYARAMGYSHLLYATGMEHVKEASGLWFILESPEYDAYTRVLDTAKMYTPAQIKEFEEMCAIKDAAEPFPHNIATGWFMDQHEAAIRGTTNGLAFSQFSVQANFQKKAVIDKVVAKTVARIRAIEKANPAFRFGGFCWDVPDPTGDFYGTKEGWTRPRQVTLAHWTGKDCVSLRPGETVDYPTYSEGTLRYRMALRRAVAPINRNAVLIVDPWSIGRDWVMRFVNGGFMGEEFREARADFVMSEGPKGFLDPVCFTNGFLRADQIAYSCDIHPYDYAGEIGNIGLAASHGAWSVWYGCPCPTAKTIRDVPPRMKLAHELPRLENLNNTPLASRRWDAEAGIYDSPTAHLCKDVVWAIHPYTKRLYFCLTSPTATIKLPAGFKVGKVTALTSLFEDYRWPKLQKVFGETPDGGLKISPGFEYVVGEAFVVTPLSLLKSGERK